MAASVLLVQWLPLPAPAAASSAGAAHPSALPRAQLDPDGSPPMTHLRPALPRSGQAASRSVITDQLALNSLPSLPACLPACCLLSFSLPLQWRNNFTSVITDQLALNLLLDEGMKGDIVEVPGEERTIYQANSTIKLHPLPVLLFPGGHIAFVQRVPWV